jgi:lysyl-tRNA synthetase class 2
MPSGTRVLAALATALAGAVTLVSSLSPNAPARQRLLEALEPDAAQHVAHALGVLGGAMLLWLALGVLRGRPARRAAIAVLAVLAVVNTAKGLDYEEALLGLVVAFALHRVLGPGRADGSRVRLAALAGLVVFATAFTAALTVLLVSGHPTRFAATLEHAAATRTALKLLVALAVGALVVALRLLLAPARPLDGHAAEEHARVAALLAEHGDDSIAPFALRADKSFHFAHGGALAYRALRETAVVAGDPLGPPGSAGPIMRSFLQFARAKGWDVILLGARADRVGEYEALGLRTMQVGLEAVVDPAAFTLDGRAAKTVRKAVGRLRRRGWTVEVLAAAQLDMRVTAELMAAEQAWRRTHRRLYGFAMASDRLWGAPEDDADFYAIARNPAGEIRAFQRYVRYRRGLSLDAMRRLDDEPNGISDGLVAAMLERARELGCEEVSLNFSAFGHLMAADTLERRSHRLFRWALRRLHGRFQLERLMRFAEKFRPAWRPRYVVYTSRTRLPLAALRVLQAEAYIKPPPRPATRDRWLPAPVPIATMRAVAWRR